MDKITFQDGVKQQDAYVTVNGQNLTVTPAKYTSPTPFSAYNLNNMQTNIENAINNLQEDINNIKTNEQVKTYDLTQNITGNINLVNRIICKKQRNVVSINGLVRVSNISASTSTAIFQNLSAELIPDDIIEGVAYGISSADVYRIYINNTDKSIYIYSPGSEIPNNRQLSFVITYIL